jgi:hypothetical protein
MSHNEEEGGDPKLKTLGSILAQADLSVEEFILSQQTLPHLLSQQTNDADHLVARCGSR